MTASQPAPTVLPDVRVVEIASGVAVAYCAQLLGQLGAEVIRIEPPEGDAVRLAGPFPEGGPDLDAGGLHRYLNGGKRSVVLDLDSDDGAALAAGLIAGSDLLVGSWRDAGALPFDDADAMRERFPDTTCVSISDFGMDGPRAGWRADSMILEALSGITYVSGAPDREPIALGVDVADYFAGLMGWIASLTALAQASVGERPGFIDVSAHEVIASSDDHSLALYAGTGAVRRRHYSRVLVQLPLGHHGLQGRPLSPSSPPQGDVPGAGRRTDRAARSRGRPAAQRAARARHRAGASSTRSSDPYLQAHTKAELLRRSDDLHLAFAPVPSVADLLADEHLRERGFWIEGADGEDVIGPPMRFSRHPAAAPGGPPPRSARLERRGPRRRRSGRPEMRFFEGLRVLDLTHVWIGPLVTRVLADFGADIIKIEHASHPDNTRAGFVTGNDASGEYWHHSPYFTKRNAGKRAIQINLGDPEGKELFLSLVREADMVVENFTPGVMERLGLGYASLREQAPSIIMCSLSGYGQTGPHAHRPAYGMSMEPASGISTLTGYRGMGPMKTGQTWIDHYGGFQGAGGAIAALIHRARTGEGQHAEVSMQEAAIPMLAARIAEYQQHGRLPWAQRRAPRGHGARLLRVRGRGRLAGDFRPRRGRVARLLPRGRPPRVARRSALRLGRRSLRASRRPRRGCSAEWAAGRSKFEAAQLLQEAGVPAAPVLAGDEVLADEQLEAREFFDPIEIVDFGEIPIERYFSPRIDGRGVPAARSRAQAWRAHRRGAARGAGPERRGTGRSRRARRHQRRAGGDGWRPRLRAKSRRLFPSTALHRATLAPAHRRGLPRGDRRPGRPPQGARRQALTAVS